MQKYIRHKKTHGNDSIFHTNYSVYFDNGQGGEYLVNMTKATFDAFWKKKTMIEAGVNIQDLEEFESLVILSKSTKTKGDQ